MPVNNTTLVPCFQETLMKEIGAVRGVRWMTHGRQRSKWEVRQTENREKSSAKRGGGVESKWRQTLLSAHCDSSDFSVRERERCRAQYWLGKPKTQKRGKNFVYPRRGLGNPPRRPSGVATMAMIRHVRDPKDVAQQ